MWPPPDAAPAAALVLAAGSSSRLGQPKQLLLYEGETLLHRAGRTAVAAGCAPVIVVTGALDAELRAAVADLPIHAVHNPDWAAGMSTSVRAGMSALAQKPGFSGPPPAVLLLLCDQPLLTASHLRELLRVQRETGAPAVASAYADTAGVPMAFGPTLFERLRTLSGAGGARQLLATLPPAQVRTVAFPGGALDVDTPAQYQQLLRGDHL